MRIYAIGDIHGHLDLLDRAHELIATDLAREGQDGDGPPLVVHLGDLVDRGPDSRGVIDFLMAGEARGENWQVLKGNHDRMFKLFLQDPAAVDPGLRADLSYLHYKIGGGPTLASYGVHAPADRAVATVHREAREAVPAAHLDWLASRPSQIRQGDLLFAHAGIRPGVAFADQTETDLVWIREPFLSDRRDHGALIVHGHTALEEATHFGNRIDLDSGAGYGRALSTVAIEGRRAFLLTPSGRREIVPQP